VKLRTVLPFLLATAVVLAGCGSDDEDGDKKGGSKAKAKGKESSAVVKDVENKQKALDKAKDEFKKSDNDPAACRNLAMAYIAISSPASAAPGEEPPPVPKDRDKNLAKSVKTLEECVDIKKDDRDLQQMLASTYMATNKYEKATPLLERLATTAKGEQRANAYYAWGLAASNAQQFDDAIKAYRSFLDTAVPKDSRVPQVRDSIKALQAAAKAPKAPPVGSDPPSDPNPDDAGGEDAPEDGGEAEDTGKDDKG